MRIAAVELDELAGGAGGEFFEVEDEAEVIGAEFAVFFDDCGEGAAGAGGHGADAIVGAAGIGEDGHGGERLGRDWYRECIKSTGGGRLELEMEGEGDHALVRFDTGSAPIGTLGRKTRTAFLPAPLAA